MAETIKTQVEDLVGSTSIASIDDWAGDAVNKLILLLPYKKLLPFSSVTEETYTTSLHAGIDVVNQRVCEVSRAPVTGSAINRVCKFVRPEEFYGKYSDSNSLLYPTDYDPIFTINNITPAVVDSYSETTRDLYSWIYATVRPSAGMGFTGNGSVLHSCKFYLKTISGIPTGNCYAKLYALTGTFGTTSVPTGDALVTSTAVAGTTIPTLAYGLVEFIFPDGYLLVDGTNYGIALYYDEGDSGHSIAFGYDGTGVPSTVGNYFEYTSAWAASASYAGCFYVYGYTI